MDRTEHTIRQLLAALPASGYDIGVLTDKGMYRVEAAPASRVLRMLPFLKHRNAHGAHIYLRPTGESCYTLLDDLTAATLARLTIEGYAPAAVVETSPGSFQAWLRHTQPLPQRAWHPRRENSCRAVRRRSQRRRLAQVRSCPRLHQP